MDPYGMDVKEVQNGTFYCAQMEVILHNTMIKIYFKGLIEFF
jgi:hypothetical protein